MNADHPMVRDTVDTLLSQESGNACLGKLRTDTSGLLLEALYVAEPTLPHDLRADRFFPPTPIRVMVDAAGEEVDRGDVALHAGELRQRLRPGDAAVLEHPQVQERLPELLEAARALANARGPEVAAVARDRMRHELDPLVERLAELARVNPSVSAAELEAARAELSTLDAGLQEVRVRLEGIRLIVAVAE